MDEHTRTLLADRRSPDREVAYQTLVELFRKTEERVAWAYEVWDALLGDLEHREGARRAFAAQMLTRLAISDPDGRMLDDFPKIAAVMKDEKFVTARHTLQSLWRVGLAGPAHEAMVVDALEQRFRECGEEKNGTLVRTDAITALGRLFKTTATAEIEARAQALIDGEPDAKSQGKQRAAWRKAIR
jgi:hypothetical protein